MGIELILVFLRHAWPYIVIGSLAAFGWIQTSRLESANDTLERERTTWKHQVEQAQAASFAATQNAIYQVEKLNADHEAVLEQAKKTAQENWDAYQRLARAIRSTGSGSGVRLPTAALPTFDTVVSAEAVDERPSDAVVDNATAQLVNQCAETTILYNEWRTICAANQQLCKVME